MKNEEADDNGLGEKKDGVELVVALVWCDRSGHEAGEKKQVTDEVLRPQLKKMRDAFEQRISDINYSKQAKNHEESAMICIVVRFVIDQFVYAGFPWKKKH